MSVVFFYVWGASCVLQRGVLGGMSAACWTKLLRANLLRGKQGYVNADAFTHGDEHLGFMNSTR